MKKSRSELKREAIVSAAIEAFNDAGFQNTSMDKIAELAQVSKRTVYNHFPSKDALFEHIVQQIHQQFMAAGQVEYQPDKTIDVQLMTIAMKELALITNHEFLGLTRVIMSECLYNPVLAKQTVAKLAITESGLIKWLEAACNDNQLSIENITLASDQFLSLLKGAAFWPQLLSYAEPLSTSEQKQVAQQTVSMFLAKYEN